MLLTTILLETLFLKNALSFYMICGTFKGPTVNCDLQLIYKKLIIHKSHIRTLVVFLNYSISARRDLPYSV